MDNVRKLASWKKTFFFQGGKTYFDKIRFGWCPNYFVPFKRSVKVCKSMERLMGDFLWEEVDEGKDEVFHFFRWEIIENPIDNGVWRSGILGYTTKPYWPNGYGASILSSIPLSIRLLLANVDPSF